MKIANCRPWKITCNFSGELHLTPLYGILQLRPSFSYLDKADAKHREREAANEGEYITSCIFFVTEQFDFSLDFVILT